jgi:hypothetical protein
MSEGHEEESRVIRINRGSSQMSRNPAKDANERAERVMHEAVDKVIDDKKKEEIGTKKAEKEVAADLNKAAQEDTQKR